MAGLLIRKGKIQARRCEDGSRDWSYAVTSLRMLGTIRSLKRQGRFFLRAFRGVWPP